MSKWSKSTLRRHVRQCVENSLSMCNAANESPGAPPAPTAGSPRDVPQQSFRMVEANTTHDLPTEMAAHDLSSEMVSNRLYTYQLQSVEEANERTISSERHTPISEQPCTIIEGSNSDSTEDAFNEILRAWALHSSVTHTDLSSLLRVLRTHPSLSSLPACARTLLRTPRSATGVQEMGNGKYCHFGLASGLQYELEGLQNVPDTICININVDGLPLAKSSTDQFWPILCLVTNCGQSTPFPVGVFFGKSKNLCANTFLRPFVSELSEILANGVAVSAKTVAVKLDAIVCDAPAKAYILGIKGHNAYASCTKCVTQGEYQQGRVCFPQLDADAMTDERFRCGTFEQHHVSETILKELPIDMVRQVPLDYMHLVCLGVVHKLLTLWFKGDRSYRLGRSTKDRISLELLRVEPYVCSDFSRKPRTLTELDRWKATEYRTLLLYTGPLVLLSRIPSHLYANFMVLHTAVTILCSRSLTEQYANYAHQLLVLFVQVFTTLYGPHMVSHNVHNLIHLTSDVREHGPLDKWSAFPFENYMQTLKSIIRKPDRPLEQLHNRTMERRKLPKQHKHTSLDVKCSIIHTGGPLPLNCSGSQYKKVVVPGRFTLRTQKRDNTCVLQDGSIVRIENLVCTDNSGEVLVIGRKFVNPGDLYVYPCRSSKFGIHSCRTLSSLGCWPLSRVALKCIRLPFRDRFAVFPLIHTNDHSCSESFPPHPCSRELCLKPLLCTKYVDFYFCIGSFPFRIIKFPEEGSAIALVHASWKRDGKCAWPNEKNPRRLEQMVLRGAEPQPDWQLHDCIEVAKFDTYKEARIKLRCAEDTSDICSDREYGRGKRKKKRKVWSDESHEVSSFSDDDDGNYQTSVLPRPPTPPETAFLGLYPMSTPTAEPVLQSYVQVANCGRGSYEQLQACPSLVGGSARPRPSSQPQPSRLPASSQHQVRSGQPPSSTSHAHETSHHELSTSQQWPSTSLPARCGSTSGPSTQQHEFSSSQPWLPRPPSLQHQGAYRQQHAQNNRKSISKKKDLKHCNMNLRQLSHGICTLAVQPSIKVMASMVGAKDSH
ncbi:uncharacterized protein LOC135391453 isoform X3 [Ornithodoros turicata]|uniref:uncharacterized protein LOC135391453 isoform X3 n=1 Tax=Ornithodoros turicata TaxID=34597 RepID=UPI00313996A5